MKKFTFLLALLSTLSANATEIIYTPTNPSFGGNPLNGNYLLSKAQSQNDHKESVSRLSQLQRFQESFDRTILSNISRLVSGMITGAEELREYSYTTSSGVLVEIIPDENNESVTIRFTDPATGETTTTIIDVINF